MSVICQNFVQNAWKKDLCSNCFKSLGDHTSNKELVKPLPVSCALESQQPRNGITTTKNGTTRYVSQATTIYQSRGLHTTWTSLLAERQDKKNGLFQLENGFQGKLLTISTNGMEKTIEVTNKVNGYKNGTLLTNGHSDEIKSGGDENGNIKGPKLKGGQKVNVGFDEGGPLVIGYGGNDYDSDDPDWDAGSDDGDFPIEALDCTDEDRAVTRLTKDNTEFNSDNSNLLRGPCIKKVSSDGKKQNVSNGTLPNGTAEKKEEADSEKLDAERKKKRQTAAPNDARDREDKNTPRREKEVATPDINKSENNLKGECGKTTNGVHRQSPSPSQHPGIRRKDPAPPQASVKPFLREQTSVAETRDRSKPKIQASENVISVIENKVKSLKNEAPKVTTANKVKSESKSIPIKKTEKEPAQSPVAIEKPVKESSSGIESDSTPTVEKMSNGYRDSPQSSALARKSFLHGKEGATDDPNLLEESAIYTPGKGDLFVGNRNSSSSSTETVEDSDSGNSSVSTAVHEEPLFVCSAELNLSNKIGNASLSTKEIVSKKTTTGSTEAVAAGASKISETTKSDRSSVVYPSVRDDSSHSDQSASPEVSKKSVKFAPPSDTDGVYGCIRRVVTPDGSTSSQSGSSARSSVDSSGDETPIYYAVSSTIIHTENQANIPHVATVRRTPVCHYAETNIFQDNRKSVSPEKDTAKIRESRLAALAQELEQARCGGNGSKRPAPSPPKQIEQSDHLPPTSQSTPSTPTMSPASANNQISTDTDSNYGNVTIYGKPAIYATPSNISGSGKGKSATISAVGGKKVLALLNFDETAKSGKKSNKFSIKKFLKRGKDSESLDNIFHGGQQGISPTNPNPKAWKNNDFDRTKMKLEIIHPMDFANKEVGSGMIQSTSEVINISKAYDSSPISSSERSVSSSQLSGSQDGIYDDEATWQGCPRSSGSTPIQVPGYAENNDMETASSHIMTTFSPTGQTPKPTSNNGPTTPVNECSQGLSNTSNKCHSGKPVRPPKPPPPPRLKSLPLGKIDGEEATVVVSNGTSNLLPPKPQVPKRLFRPSMKSEYANLGDIRSPMAPKKPERFPNSRPSTPGSLELSGPYYDDDNAYELVGVETDSNYHTQSDITDDINSDSEPIYTDGYSMCTFDFNTQERKREDSASETIWREADKVTVTVQRATNYERQGEGPNKPPGSSCGDKVDIMAWLSLEQSYAIVAAANHEVLAKLIDQVMNQKTCSFLKPDGRNVTWEDFYLQQNNPVRIIGEKVIYNAVFRHTPKREVTLLVTAQPSGLLRRDSYSKNLFLGTFTDQLPRSGIDVGWCNQATSDTVQAQVYILPKSEAISVQGAFFDKPIPTEKSDATQFEKELCFVYLQLIHALKILQAHGTEDVDMNQEDLILTKDEKDQMSNLIFMSGDFVSEQEDGSNFDKVSLCQYALIFLLRVLHIPDAETLNNGNRSFSLSPCVRKIFITVAKALTQEKASSLSKAKNLMEFHLWGPKDKVYACLSGSQRMEETLQRWLDIERAQNLRLLVRSHKNISACEEHQLQFLVRTSAKALKDMTSTLSFEKL